MKIRNAFAAGFFGTLGYIVTMIILNVLLIIGLVVLAHSLV